MFIKRLFLTCMLLGTSSQIIFTSTDRHAAWIEHVENEMIKKLSVEPQKEKVIAAQDEDCVAAIVAAGIAISCLIYLDNNWNR